MTVVPAKQQLAGSTRLVRGTVAELDGEARYDVLVAHLEAAWNQGLLVPWALAMQAVVHESHGNYLYEYYLARKRHNEKRAHLFAELMADRGVAIGPSSGHFVHLEHMDPSEPLPSSPPDPSAAGGPMETWVDAFVSVRYDVSYKPNRKGALSEYLQVTYKDGTELDIDIRLISDNNEPAPAHSMAYAHLGPGNRLVPLRMNRQTTPRLWRAKHELALATMYQSNQDYETTVSIGLAGVMSNLPIGLVVPVKEPTPMPRVRSRTRAQAPCGPPRNIPAENTTPTPPQAKAPAEPVAEPIAEITWPPKPPSGPKPAIAQSNAAEWRYQRYAHDAYKKGKSAKDILPFDVWKRRHFDPVVNGGRPGRPGSQAHQRDVDRNNGAPNNLYVEKVGSRYPDGIGEPGQTVIIRGREIVPRGSGRVIVESDHFIRKGSMPNSEARAQIRDMRKAEPSATFVVTDLANPESPPLVYPPGTQPPPKGPLPVEQSPVVPYP